MRSAIRASVAIALGAALILILAGCGTQHSATNESKSQTAASPVAAPVATPHRVASPTAPPTVNNSRELPPVGGIWDYQLGGDYTPAPGVSIVTRDSTSGAVPGLYSICYVNGFQTQPGAVWPSGLILHTGSGEPLVDPNWPDEHILDISSQTNRASAAARLDPVIDACAAKGFRGIEFDNLDSYTRSNGALTLSDAIAFATLLVARAHTDGLAAAQKNTTQLGARGRDQIGFDFAVAEQCDRYQECAAYTSVYGEHVLDVEYADDLRRPFAQFCASSSRPSTAILRDLELVPRGSAGYVYQHC